MKPKPEISFCLGCHEDGHYYYERAECERVYEAKFRSLNGIVAEDSWAGIPDWFAVIAK